MRSTLGLVATVRSVALNEPYSIDVVLERITVDPDRMGSVPCIRDLRVTVSMVLGQIAAAINIEDLLDNYPYLERDDVLAALEYAAAVVNGREVPLGGTTQDGPA